MEMPHNASSLVPRPDLIKALLMLMLSLGNVVLLARLLHGKSVLVIKEATMDATPLLLGVLHHGLETVAEEATIVVVMLTTVVNQQLRAPPLPGNNRPLHSLELLLLVMLAILLPVTLVDILLSKPWVLHLDLQLLLD